MKGKFWRKALAAALALLIVSGSVPIQPFSRVFENVTLTASAHNLGTSGSCGDNATYTITGEEGNYTLTISGTGAIKDYAFYNTSTNLSGIKTVIIEEGITSIGQFAFSTGYNNAEFTSLSIPASVKSIGANAFRNCNSLFSVTIANGSQLTSIGDGAFQNCHFSSIILPCPYLASVGSGAFTRYTADYQNLSEIICLTETALSVHQYVFYNNSNQVNVYMLGSQKVNWNRAKAVKGLVTDVVAGDNVSSLTADYSAATTKTVNGTTYYVSGSTVKLTLASTLAGDDVVFRANGVDLVKDSDGTYSLTLPDNATTVTVTASIPQNISDAVVTLSEDRFDYDGTAKTPAVSSVVLGGTTLTEGTDYEVSYSNNTNAGNGTVTVTGKGDYYGTATAQFAIIPSAIEGLTYNETAGCFDIGTLAEFQSFMSYANAGHGCAGLTFRLIDDIDMTGQTYTPIPSFIGTFNGNTHTITGLSGSNGIFTKVIAGGLVTDLTLSGVNISGSSQVGAVVGNCSGVIENCHVTGSVSGGSEVGGIVGYELQTGLGYTNNPHVSGCSFSGTVTGTYHVGGIVGMTIRQIQNCTVSGSAISGNYDVGGIAGFIQSAYEGTTTYDISGCTVAGVSINAVESSYSGKVCGAVDQEITTDADVIATYIHDNTIYYSVTAGEGITITYQSGDKKNFDGTDYYKTGATFTIGHTSRDGYTWNKWEAKTGGLIAGNTLTIQDSDVVLEGDWTPIDYTITKSATNGTIKAIVDDTETDIAHIGDTVTLNVTPNEGYAVKSVSVNGEGIEPVEGVYSFTMPAEDVTVSAEFEESKTEPITTQISYVTANGQASEEVTAIVLDENTVIDEDFDWSQPVYYVTGDVIFSGAYFMFSNPNGVTLILADDANLNVGTIMTYHPYEDGSTEYGAYDVIITKAVGAEGVGKISSQIICKNFVQYAGQLTGIVGAFGDSTGEDADYQGTITLDFADESASANIVTYYEEMCLCSSVIIPDGKALTDGTSTYTGILTGDDLKAISGQTLMATEIEPIKTEVIINSVDINGNSTSTTVYAETYTSADYTVPADINLDGYNFIGWKVNDTLYTTVGEVQSAVETLVKAGTAVTVAVDYEKKTDKFDVTVTNGTLSGSKTSDNIQVSTLVTVKANTIEGKKFSHWLKNGVKASSNESYTFFMPSSNVTLEAVFVDEKVEVEQVGTAIIESVTPNASTGKVAFVSVVNVPTNCTMVKGGLVATSDSTIGGNVTADNAAFVKLSTKATANTKNLKYTWTKSSVTESTVWYVRSYLVYKDSKGVEHTVYSDAVKANINGIIND